MDERERKIGLNEALFRQVNERLEGLNQAFATVTEQMQVVCECGDLNCVESISLTAEEYEHVRDDAAQFVVVPGHVAVGVEEVTREADGYVVIRKTDRDAIRLAERTDPRS